MDNSELIKIRLLKEWWGHQIGEIIEIESGLAPLFVKTGKAEYYNPEAETDKKEKPLPEATISHTPEEFEEDWQEKALKRGEITLISPPKKYLNILQNPELLNLIDSELNKKIVRENEARKVIFLVANMRNVENLSKGSDNLIINALSGTGKDHVVGAVFDLIPESEKEELIRTTPKVLAYTRNRKIIESRRRKK